MKRRSAIGLAAGIILCVSIGGGIRGGPVGSSGAGNLGRDLQATGNLGGDVQATGRSPIQVAVQGEASPPAPTATPAAAPAKAAASGERKEATPMAESVVTVPLPPAKAIGEMSLEESLARRRSVREFSSLGISLEEAAQLLWAAQGITDHERGYRTAPSAGALFPLEVYLVAGKVEGLPPGVYKYDPKRHRLTRVVTGDKRAELCRAALDQDPVRKAAADIVIAAVIARTEAKYGARAERYVDIEVGHAGQNVLLQAVARGLGAVPIGAFDDKDVKRVVGMPSGEDPLYILPIGPVR